MTTRPTKTIHTNAVPLVFDGNLALCFLVEVVSATRDAIVKNIAPGAIYTFVFHQDAKGHPFTWPASCLNASPVDTTPGATTVQNFVGNADGNLQANLPATWREL
jgi:hypothetical protein